MSTAHAIEQAIESYRQGQLPLAATQCQKILAMNPADSRAHHVLGLVALAQQQSSAAIDHLRQAIAGEPNLAQRHLDLGAAYRQAGQFREAVAAGREAVRLAPHEAIGHIELGNWLREIRDFHAAETSYREALALCPQSHEAWNNLGNVLQDQSRLDEALVAFQEAARLLPDSHIVLLNLGHCQQALELWAEAEASYRRSLEIAPNFAIAHFHLGKVLYARGNAANAVAHFQQALAQLPDLADGHFRLGLALQELGHYREARACYDRVLAQLPDDPHTHYQIGSLYSIDRQNAAAQAYYQRATELEPENSKIHFHLAISMQMQDKYEEALGVYARALALAPDDELTHYFHGMARLTLGDFAAGWPEFLWRLKSTRYSNHAHLGRVWQGEPLDGAPILAYGDGGMGDTLQFVRYLPMVQARGGQVTLAVHAGLVQLLCDAGFRNVVACDERQWDAEKWKVSLLSLPAIFGTRLESIPAPIPYLFAQPERIALWRDRLSPLAGLRVGINWQGSSSSPFERRALPLRLFEPLARIGGVTLISLQRDAGLDELPGLAGRFAVVDLGPELDRDGAFLDTAAVMKNLDLVITCDTSIGHLAGALGVPVWVPLLLSCDWRWMRKRSDTPWYPSMRLFRQTTLDDWSDVFQQMTQQLELLASTHAARSPQP